MLCWRPNPTGDRLDSDHRVDGWVSIVLVAPVSSQILAASMFIVNLSAMFKIARPIQRDQQGCVRPLRRTSRAGAILLSVVLALAACSDAIAPLPLGGAPDMLEFSVGGYGGGGSRVSLSGDTVVMWRLSPGWTPGTPIDTVRVIPDSSAWRAFWLATKQAGTDQWHTQYNDNGIADGLGWDLRLAGGGRQITSWGSNAYPDRFGHEHEGAVTDEFRIFVAALSDLVGRTVWF